MSSALQQRAALGWRPAGSRPKLQARSAVIVHAHSLSGHSSLGPWERLLLARRKVDLAVREEDYKAAAQAKREVELLTERLPANKAVLNALLQRLDRLAASVSAAAAAAAAAKTSPGSSVEEQEARKEAAEALHCERLAALAQLGELGDWDAAPALAAALHDGDAAAAAAAEDALWALFMTCPTLELQQMMSQGVSLMRRPEQWDQALDVFNRMVAAAPTYAEAYNKRATVLFLQHRYSDAVADCKVVLQMNPYHFAAASGMGMCCASVGDKAGALAAFQQAVAINPRLKHLRQHISQLRQLIKEEEEEKRGRGQQGKNRE